MNDFKSFFDVLIGNLIVLILVAATITLFSMLENLAQTVQKMSKVMIQDRLDLTEQELNGIFDPINTLLKVTRQQAENGIIRKINDKEIMNSFFVPIIENYSSVSSLMLANDH